MESETRIHSILQRNINMISTIKLSTTRLTLNCCKRGFKRFALPSGIKRIGYPGEFVKLGRPYPLIACGK